MGHQENGPIANPSTRPLEKAVLIDYQRLLFNLAFSGWAAPRTQRHAQSGNTVLAEIEREAVAQSWDTG